MSGACTGYSSLIHTKRVIPFGVGFSFLFLFASGASKFICMLDRVLMKLEAELVELVGIKAKLFKGIYRVRDVQSPTHPQQNI